MDLVYELCYNEKREKPEPKKHQIQKKEGTIKSRNNKHSCSWFILFEVFFLKLKAIKSNKQPMCKIGNIR